MRRILTYICSLLLLAQSLSAGGNEFLRRLHPGLEWGYTATMFNFHHFNYLDESIGFRVDEQEWEARYNTNAYIYSSIAYDFLDFFNASIMIGYEGIDKDRRIVPLLTRFSYYPFGLDQDGIYLFLDGGITLPRKENDRYTKQGQLGGGYSFRLDDRSRLAFNLGFRLAYDRPDVWDPIEEEYVSAHNIRRNEAWYCALKIGVSLSF